MQSKENQITILGIFIWGIGALFFLYEFFLRTFVGSIAKQLIHDLNLTVEQFTLIGSAYYFAYGIMQIPVGILSDKFGVKKIMIFATLICAVATFIFAHANSFLVAIAGRALMGFGSSFAFVCLLVLASNWFPKRLFGFFAGLSQFVGTLGPFLAGGPLISLLNKSHMSWRFSLSLIGSLGILLMLLSLLFVRNAPTNSSDEMIFLVRQDPIIIRLKRLFSNPQAWVVAVYSMTIYVSIAVMAAVWGTDYLEARGLSQVSASYMISIAWISFAIACPSFGFLSDYFKRRKPFLVICSLLGLISMTALLFFNFTSIYIYILIFILFGVACTGQSVGFAAIAEHSNANVKASALGLNNSLMTTMGAVLPLIISYIISHFSKGVTAENLTSQDIARGLIVLPLVYLISLVFSLFLFRETYCKAQKNITIAKVAK